MNETNNEKPIESPPEIPTSGGKTTYIDVVFDIPIN